MLNLRRILDYKLGVFCTKTCRMLILWSFSLFYVLTKLRIFSLKVQDILIMMVKLLSTTVDTTLLSNEPCEIWDAFNLRGVP